MVPLNWGSGPWLLHDELLVMDLLNRYNVLAIHRWRHLLLISNVLRSRILGGRRRHASETLELSLRRGPMLRG